MATEAGHIDSKSLVPALVAGVMTGTVVAILSTSFAVLIFSGSLAQYAGVGVGITLFTAAVVGAVVAVMSSYPGTIAFPQDKIAPILALMASMIVAGSQGMPAENVFLTVIAALAAATLLTGLFLTGLGVFKLGGLIRFIPYPVIGGFLAGTGWLLIRGSVRVMTGKTLTLDNVAFVFSPHALMQWIPGLVFAVALLLCMRRFRHFLTMPVLMALGMGLFYAIIAAAGMSIEAARGEGLLLAKFPEGSTWKPLFFSAASNADWGAVLGQAGTMATALIISGIAVLLNSSAIELAANQDMDLNRELKVAGAANLLSGLGGGIVGFHALSISSLPLKMGVRSRAVGLISAAICLILLVAGASVIAYFPVPVLGGLLMFLGLSFMVEWLVDGYPRLPHVDYAVMLLILGTVGVFGYLQGIGVGIVACAVHFIVNYSRVGVTRYELTGDKFPSNVDRPPVHMLQLKRHGQRILILNLQGYMFFGTAYGLLTRVIEHCSLKGPEPVKFVILDFRRVTGMDSSSGMSFIKMRQFTEKHGVELLFAAMPEHMKVTLEHEDVKDSKSGWKHFPDLDHAIEQCEDVILSGLPPPSAEDEDFKDRLASIVPDPEMVKGLLPYLERMEVPAGEVLLRQGDIAGELYYIQHGSVTVQIVGANGAMIRLRTMKEGNVIGEMGLYLSEERIATATADRACLVFKLTGTALERLEREAPDVAAAFHRFMACRLSERLRNTDNLLKAMLD
jgi:SulP family sulfate permease